MSQLFTIETVQLNSATSFSQYIISLKGLRLVTIIGENHGDGFDCGAGEKTSIAHYVKEMLQKNPRTLVLIEVDLDFRSQDRDEWPESAPLKEIMELKDNQDRLLGFDWRNEWLDPAEREILYHDEKAFNRKSISQIYQTYLKPFLEMYPYINEENYTPELYTFLTITYPQTLKERVEIMMNDSNLLKSLKHFWKDVADWKLLCHILSNSNYDSIVAVVGERHSESLDKLLVALKVRQVTPRQTGTSGSCVKILTPFRTLPVQFPKIKYRS